MSKFNRPELNKIYIMLCLLGGILHAKDIKPVWKILWIIFNCLPIGIILSSCITGLLNLSDINIHLVISSLSPAIIFSLVGVMYLFFMKIFDKLTPLLKELDSEDLLRQPNSHLFQVTNLAIGISILLPILFFIFNAAKIFEFPSPNFEDVTLYIFPPPSFFKIDSIDKYLAMGFMESLAILPSILVEMLFIKTILYIIHVLNEKFNWLRENIKILSRYVSDELELSHQREFNIHRQNPTMHNIWLGLREKENRNDLNHYFDEKLKEHVIEFKTLIEYILILKEICKPLFSIFVLHNFIVLTYVGHMFFTAIYQNAFSGDQAGLDILALILLTYSLYVISHFGSRIEEMIEEISDAVYSTPWYLLSPQNRRNNCIFLLTTQKKVSMYSCRVLKIEYAMVPIVLKAVYSYVVVLQTLLERQL